MDKAIQDDPLIKAYRELRKGFEMEWIAEHIEDGLTQEAYDFGLIPDNESVRRMLEATR